MRVALPLIAMIASGCMTTPVQRAETLGEGDFAVGIEPGVAGFAGGAVTEIDTDGDGVPDTTSNPNIFLPAFNLSARYGVTDRFDLGARIGSSAYEISGKVMLTDPAAGVPVSIAPYTTFAAIGTGGAAVGFAVVKVPVLIGVPVGRSQLVLGPHVTNLIGFGGGGGATAGGYRLEAGTSVGFNGRVGDAFAIHPEFGFGYGLAGSAGASDAGSVSFGAGGLRWAFTLGLVVGNKLDK